MSERTLGSPPVGPAPSNSGDHVAVRLFGASARNLASRMVHSLAMACVAYWFIGPLWTALWFVATWSAVFAGIRLMTWIQTQPNAAAVKGLRRGLLAINVINSALYATMVCALWSTGEEHARLFALVMLFIGATYVLLQYYADLDSFVLLLAPYAAGFGFICYDLWRDRGLTQPFVMVTLTASAVALWNLMNSSRRLLDASRSALRQARERAREGEIAAETANAAKSDFLAIMSHEIRTPLNGVLGMAQAVAADALAPVQRERISVIQQSGESLLAILNDILDLAKIESGKLELEAVDFDLGMLAQGAHAAFTALANKKGISFALDVGAARGVYHGDPTRVRQILYNLISNALKFTEHGEIRVTASHAEGRLRLGVSDTGIGIDAEGLAKLFVRFSQVDASTTRRFGGTGLGLSICRELVQLMGGELTVESELGRGSTFSVEVPLARVGEEDPDSGLQTPPTKGEPPALALRVLAAEDNVVNQLVLKTLLHQIGVDLMVVADGQAAVDAWETGEWDVVLMDVQMPRLDGPTAARLIRRQEAMTGRARTPIIALTANAMPHQVAEYLAAGMDGHVAKPIKARLLLEALQTAKEAGTADHRGGAGDSVHHLTRKIGGSAGA